MIEQEAYIKSLLGNVRTSITSQKGEASVVLCRAESGKTFYVKDFSQTSSPAASLAREIEVSSLIRDIAGVPTPRISPVIDGERGIYLGVMDEVLGVSLDKLFERLPEAESARLSEAAGAALSRIHKIKGDYFGDLNGQDQSSIWAECFGREVVRSLNYCVSQAVLSNSQAAGFMERLSSLDVQAETPTLIHGDYLPQNIIIDTTLKQINGILDFELSRFWIAEWDITHILATLFGDNPATRQGFLKGYVSSSGADSQSLLQAVNYYSPFESLFYWTKGWSRDGGIRDDILRDIQRVTA
jgi:aminoglycoside phosphotransferase (APT) family kinase protein